MKDRGRLEMRTGNRDALRRGTPGKSNSGGRPRYCYPQCRDPWFNECADCWKDGGNPALWPKGKP